MNTDIPFKFHVISQQLDLYASLSSLREEIHEQEVNLEKLGKLSFSMETLVRGTQAKDTQVMLTTNKETKKV